VSKLCFRYRESGIRGFSGASENPVQAVQRKCPIVVGFLVGAAGFDTRPQLPKQVYTSLAMPDDAKGLILGSLRAEVKCEERLVATTVIGTESEDREAGSGCRSLLRSRPHDVTFGRTSGCYG